MEKEFIIVQNQFVQNTDDYSYREQFVYILLSSMRDDLFKVTTTSVDMLASILGLSLHSKNRAVVKEMISSMEEKGLISLYEDVMKTKPVDLSKIKVSNAYSIDVKDVEIDSLDKSFTKVDIKDLLKFIGLDDKGKELSFSVYFNIIRRIFDNEYNRRYSFPSIETISKETGINRKTIMKHLKLLMDNEILYYETVSLGKYKDKNLYSKWDNKQCVSDAVAQIECGLMDI